MTFCLSGHIFHSFWRTSLPRNPASSLGTFIISEAKGLVLMTSAFSCSLFLLMDFFVFPLQAHIQLEDQYEENKKICSYFQFNSTLSPPPLFTLWSANRNTHTGVDTDIDLSTETKYKEKNKVGKIHLFMMSSRKLNCACLHGALQIIVEATNKKASMLDF